ncbi:MAG: N-acetylmuramoyl-L-alanine amidase [Candidatus Paceibacterota bacterium]|jgi:N-acetylmuramoyl-L-alanine amidase
MKKILFLFFILIFTFVPVFFVNAVEPIKILLVPGHDDEIWGAQYGNLKEADMNLRLATDIFNILKKDKKFKVFITRDKNGYTKEFSNYFTNEREKIIEFKNFAKIKTQKEISDGSFVEKSGVPHIAASEDMAIKLYGINKWANENKIDAVIHIHFNDYPRKTKWQMGKYKGFAIYIPEEQMLNSKESTTLAKKIFTQLKKKYTISNYEKELGGLIQDQQLIALGSKGTLNEKVKSVLIEYGYIYRFGNKIMRFKAYNNMANATVKGIKNYFSITP